MRSIFVTISVIRLKRGAMSSMPRPPRGVLSSDADSRWSDRTANSIADMPRLQQTAWRCGHINIFVLHYMIKRSDIQVKRDVLLAQLDMDRFKSDDYDAYLI